MAKVPQTINTLSNAGSDAMGKLLQGRLIEGKSPVRVSYGGDRYIVQVEQQTFIGKITGIAKTQYYVFAGSDKIPVPAFVLTTTTGVALLDPTAIPFRVDANGKWTTDGGFVLLDSMIDYNAPVVMQQADAVLYTDAECTTTLKSTVYNCMVQPTINQSTTMTVDALANYSNGVFASASAGNWSFEYLFGKVSTQSGVVLNPSTYALTEKTMQPFPIELTMFSDAEGDQWKKDFGTWVKDKKTPAARDLGTTNRPLYTAPLVYLPCICGDTPSVSASACGCCEAPNQSTVSVVISGCSISALNGTWELASTSTAVGAKSYVRGEAEIDGKNYEMKVVTVQYGGVGQCLVRYLTITERDLFSTLPLPTKTNVFLGGSEQIPVPYAELEPLCAESPAVVANTLTSGGTATISCRAVIDACPDDEPIHVTMTGVTKIAGPAYFPATLPSATLYPLGNGYWHARYKFDTGWMSPDDPEFGGSMAQNYSIVYRAYVYSGTAGRMLCIDVTACGNGDEDFDYGAGNFYAVQSGDETWTNTEDGSGHWHGIGYIGGHCVVGCGAAPSISASTSASISASQSVSTSVSQSVSTSVSASQSVSVSTSVNNDCQPPWEAGIFICYDGNSYLNWEQQNGEVRIYYLGGDNTKDYIQSWFGSWQDSIGNGITGITCGECPSVSASVSASVSTSTFTDCEPIMPEGQSGIEHVVPQTVCYNSKTYTIAAFNGLRVDYYTELGIEDGIYFAQDEFGNYKQWHDAGAHISGVTCGACPSVSVSHSASVSTSVSVSASISQSVSASVSQSASVSASTSTGGCVPTAADTPHSVIFDDVEYFYTGLTGFDAGYFYEDATFTLSLTYVFDYETFDQYHELGLTSNGWLGIDGSLVSCQGASTSTSTSQSVSASTSGGTSACAPTGPYTPTYVTYNGRCDAMGEGAGCYQYSGYPESLRYITNADDYYAWYGVTLTVGAWYKYDSGTDSFIPAEGVECGPIAPSSLCHAGTTQLDLSMDQNGAWSYTAQDYSLYLWKVYDAATFNAQFDPPTNFTNGQFVESYPGWLDVHTDVTAGAC
jgi:hypothetical protein